MTQRTCALPLEAFAGGEGDGLGRQAGQHAAQRLRAMPLHGAEVLELGNDLLDNLAVPRRPAAGCLRPGPARSCWAWRP